VEEAIYYKETADAVYVKATGHVTALVCPPLKARIFSRLDRDPPVERVAMDLSECEYMDSTFLGLIVGTQKRYSAGAPASPRRVVSLFGVNDACRGLLRTIGVIGLVDLVDGAAGSPQDMERLDGGERASARFLLDAHEELSDLSAENRKRFSALTSVLRSAVESENGKQ
jgi:hypothetical protein